MILALLVACSSPAPESASPAAAAPVARVVALAPAITQVLVQTHPELLVGADHYSVTMLGETAVQDVGNPRALSAEGVLSLNPSAVLLTDTAGPPEVIAQLRAAGVHLVELSHDKTLEGVRALIDGVGEAIDQDVSGVRETFDGSCKELPSLDGRSPSAMFVYSRGPSAMHVSGTGTAGDAMLGLAGLRNVVGAYEGYKPLTPEAAMAADPDWVVMTTGGLEASGGLDGLSNVPGLAELRAVREGHVVQLDDVQLLAFGLETCTGAQTLASAVR